MEQHYTSVYQTTNYDMFKTIDGNRMVNQLHVDKLKSSMTEKQLITPIITNEKYEIIDGQHRFNAVSDLGLPLYYIVCNGYDLPDVHRLNERSHTWKPKDFLDGYSKFAEKDPRFQDYVVLKQFIEDHKLTPNLGIFLTKGEMNDTEAMVQFKNGYFKVINLESAELFLYQLEDFHPYFSEYYKTSTFLKAFRIFSSSKKYNHDNMVKKLKYMSGYLQNRSTIGQYLELLSDIYNTKLNDKYRIHFKGEREIA
jgi:hypothetical protein